jgi:hypothetical protein
MRRFSLSQMIVSGLTFLKHNLRLGGKFRRGNVPRMREIRAFQPDPGAVFGRRR